MSSSLPERILRSVSRPARYTGGEWNSVRRSWDEARVRVCLAFPDVYEAGVLRPSFCSLYETLNADPDILAERVFAPWPDMAAALRAHGRPLTSLESGRPLGDFDVIAFCLPRELAAATLLEMLDLAGLPLDAAERDGRHPLVAAWEERPINPEPVAPFIDAFLVGDAEVVFPRLLAIWRGLGGAPGRPPSRPDLLRSLAQEDGIYAPSLDEPGPDAGVRRLLWEELLPAPVQPVVPYLQAMNDRPTVEMQRGLGGAACAHANAGLAAPPVRMRPPQEVAEAVRRTLQSTGFEEVSLGAPCLCGYPAVEEVASAVAKICASLTAKLRLPPIALQSVTTGLLRPLAGTRTPLNLGPIVPSGRLAEDASLETGLAALRDAATQDAVGNVRVEVMLGHPGIEEGDSLAGAAHVLRALRRALGGQVQVRVNASFFVPRPFTLRERDGQPSVEVLQGQARELRSALGKKVGVVVRASPQMAQVEAALVRGDRRLAAVVRRAWASGCVLDTSNESFRPDLWRQAFEAEGLDLDACVSQPLDTVAPLPWAHLGDPSSRAGVAYVRRQTPVAASS
jgi:hypothetical protein